MSKNSRKRNIEFERETDEEEEEDSESDEQQHSRETRSTGGGKRKKIDEGGKKGKKFAGGRGTEASSSSSSRTRQQQLQKSQRTRVPRGESTGTKRDLKKTAARGRASTITKILLFQMSSQAVLRLNDEMVRICHIFGITPPVVKTTHATSSGGGGAQTRGRIKKGNFVTPDQLAE